MMDFPATRFQHFVGKTVERIDQDWESDEGLFIRFTDGTAMHVRFSGCEGDIFAIGKSGDRIPDDD